MRENGECILPNGYEGNKTTYDPQEEEKQLDNYIYDKNRGYIVKTITFKQYIGMRKGELPNHRNLPYQHHPPNYSNHRNLHYQHHPTNYRHLPLSLLHI